MNQIYYNILLLRYFLNLLLQNMKQKLTEKDNNKDFEINLIKSTYEEKLKNVFILIKE